jgi:hypothetical protein
VSAGRIVAVLLYAAGVWTSQIMSAANVGDGPCELSLTRQSPIGECDIPTGSPAAMAMPVRPRANLTRVPVGLRIAVQTDSGENTVLPPVSLFPADQEGRFLMRLPAQARRLIITLMDGPGQLAVDVGPITWLPVAP